MGIIFITLKKKLIIFLLKNCKNSKIQKWKGGRAIFINKNNNKNFNLIKKLYIKKITDNSWIKKNNTLILGFNIFKQKKIVIILKNIQIIKIELEKISIIITKINIKFK